MTRCSRCNTDNADGAQFCANCGYKLDPAQPDSTEASADGESGNIDSAPGIGFSRRKVIAIGTASLVVLLCIGFFAVGWLLGRSGSFSLDEIPDNAFRIYLSETVDTDGDGMISPEESESVTQMGVADAGDIEGNGLVGLGISSLEGVDHFSNLNTIVCSNNAISDVDLSHNTKLETIICNNSQVEKLALPQTDVLQSVQATGNHLIEVDISANEGLVNIGFDPGVHIIANELADDADLSGLKDLALLYAASLEMLPPDQKIPSDVEPGQNAELDGYLIWSAVHPEHLEGEGMGAGGNAYGFASVPIEGFSAAVSDDTGRAILSAVYGWSPDDMSYIDSSHYVLDRIDGGWSFKYLDNPFIGNAELKNVATTGKIVSFDITFVARFDVTTNPTNPSIYRMVAVEDDASPFGYHLISCQEISTRTVPPEVVESAGVEAVFHVTTDHFEFTVPVYWRGRVSWSVVDNEIVIDSATYPSRQLASIEIGPEGSYGGGSVETATLCHALFASGWDLIVFGPLYSYMIPASRSSEAGAGFGAYSDEEAQELIDIQTGGTFSFEELQNDFSSSGEVPDTNGWMQETIPECVALTSTEGLGGNEGTEENEEAVEEPEKQASEDSEADLSAEEELDAEGPDQVEAPQGLTVSEEEFVARAREVLKVPDDGSITYSIDEPYVWEATATTIVNISFYRDGELIASAGCTTDGSPATSIFVYDGN